MRISTIVLLVLALACPGLGQAQLHDKHWMFYQGGIPQLAASYCQTYLPPLQDNYKFGMSDMDFTASGLVVNTRCDSLRDLVLSSGYISMSDEAGNYLFSTDGKRVIDSTGNLMQNGDSLSFRAVIDFFRDLYNTSNVLVYTVGNIVCLPYPGHPGRYIIVEQTLVPEYDSALFNYVLRNRGLVYHVVDMAANNGRGALVQRYQPIPLPTDSLEGGNMKACRHANGRDWWIIQTGYKNNCYHRILLSPGGLDYLGKQYVGQFTGHPDRGEGFIPAFSPDGAYYARANYFNGGSFSVFTFDRQNGLLADEININPTTNMIEIPYAVEFSPSSKKLYVSSGIHLLQFDLSVYQRTFIEISEFAILDTINDPYIQYSHPLYGPSSSMNVFERMQLAPDGRIYMAPRPGMLISAIEAPDVQGAACSFNWFSAYTPTYPGVSLPNNPHYRLGALTGSICDTLGLSSLQSTSYWLDFGQVEAGSSTTLSIDVVSRVGYPASLDTLQYRQGTGVFSSSLALPTMLPKYDTLHYDVTFSPTASGYVEDTLELHSNYGVVRVRLTGNGISSVGTVASQAVSVQLYPNPASNTVTVYAQGAEIAQALLYSSRGELLKTQSIAQSKGQLDLAGLSPGLYLVELVLADGRRGISKLLVINY